MRYQSKHSIARVVRSMSVRARVFAAVIAAFLAGGVALTATAASASTGTPPSVPATTSTVLVSAPKPVDTGGSFVSPRSTRIGTLTLSPGTYLLVFNAKATPNDTNLGGVQVFPQFFVYTQPKNPSFSGDLFNVGAGALETPTAAEFTDGDLIDSYYSGSDVVTVPAGGLTLYFYAFGYDSNQGSGTYELDTATVSLARLGS